MATIRRVIRAVPLWLLAEYVRDAGGEATSETTFEGNRWRVSLTQVEDFAVGSLRVGQVRLTMDGDDEAVAALEAALEPRLLRAGG